ncbi:GNAT family N-acetyltransferase [Actinosynnema sp. NPDC050436]|uniref:GNAT family N-acetyltransferase n=1 Tax=Actinosynnema sp. NPDC050436 TaxID=3155659 RepID=UPI0033EDCDD2
MTVAPDLRPLDLGDLPACLDLARERDWAPETRAWLPLFEFGRVYGLRDPDGALAATVSVVAYGTRLAVIGAMLVAPRHARRGVGTAVFRAALERAGTATAWLTATPAGAPIYHAAGFRRIATHVRYSGTPRVAGPPGSRPATVHDLPAIARLDEEALGVPRHAVLAHLFSVAAATRVVDGPDGPLGYGIAWRGACSHVLGPLVTADDDTARVLADDLSRDVARPLRVDVAAGSALVTWARRAGLAEGSTAGEMVLGDDLPGDRRRVRVFATGALG